MNQQTNTELLDDDNEEETEEQDANIEIEEQQQYEEHNSSEAPALDCPIAKALFPLVPSNGQPAQASSVTVVINGKERVFTRFVPDIINDTSKHVHLFEMKNHCSEYRIKPLFRYVPFNGRLSKPGGATAVVCPCVIKYNPNHKVPQSKYVDYDKKDIILLSLWRTRCQSPVFHLVLLIPGETECRVYKENIVMFFKTRYCDPTATFDEENAIK